MGLVARVPLPEQTIVVDRDVEDFVFESDSPLDLIVQGVRRCWVDRGRISLARGSVLTIKSDQRLDLTDVTISCPNLAGLHTWLVRFERCVFDFAVIADWRTNATSLVDCTVAGRGVRSGVIFCGPISPWADREPDYLAPAVRAWRNEFTGNDLRALTFAGGRVGFTDGVDLLANQLPDDVVVCDAARLASRLYAIALHEPVADPYRIAKAAEVLAEHAPTQPQEPMPPLSGLTYLFGELDDHDTVLVTAAIRQSQLQQRA